MEGRPARNGMLLLQGYQAIWTASEDTAGDENNISSAVDEVQFGFMPRKGTTDAIFIVRQLMEKHLANKKTFFLGQGISLDGEGDDERSHEVVRSGGVAGT